MADIRSLTHLLEPVRATVVLACPVASAFDAFTRDIAAWWPLATHSVWQDRARTCRFEGGPDGRIVEVHDDGRETTWAEVLVWESPHRLVLHWHPGLPPEQGQEVEVQFLAEGAGTRVTLEHRGWQQTDEDRQRRARYQEGWTGLLERELSAWMHASESARARSSPGARP